MFKIMNVLSKPSMQIILYLGRRYRDGYYVREISRNLGISLGSASQSLRTLEEAGLVLKEHRGRLVIYRANMQNFLLLQDFSYAMKVREGADYGSVYSEDSALELQKSASRIYEVAKRLIS